MCLLLMSSSYVSRETAEVGVAICIKPAEARNEAGYLQLLDNTPIHYPDYAGYVFYEHL